CNSLCCLSAARSRRARPAPASATNGITSATTTPPSPTSPITLYRIRSSIPAVPPTESGDHTPRFIWGQRARSVVHARPADLRVGRRLTQRALGLAQRGGLALGGERGQVDLLQQAALAMVVDVRVVGVIVAEGAEPLGELALLGRFALVDVAQILGPANHVGR